MSERKREFRTVSGISLREVYDEIESSRVSGELGLPGHYPFTRGVQKTMYRTRYWTMRQYAGFGTAAQTNERYRYLLSQGTTGLSVAFDLPTQMGRDSDHPLAAGEVGRVGVAIDTLADMEVLFEGIALEDVSTSMTINATAAILLAMYLALARKRNIPWRKLRGTIQNDILKEYIARGTYVYPPKPALKIVTDVFEFASREVPAWNTISISGYHIREAGANAVHEMAFTLADGIAYVEAALARGLDVDDFAPRLAFFFACHSEFLEEIAKFRAARRMWARIMKERFGAKKDKSMMLRFHTQTGGSTLTANQPEVNVVRTAYQALAAVLGGTQSLHTNSFDEALSLPSEKAAILALRTQQVLAHETGIGDVVDPLGGSFAIESLTNELEQKAWEYLERIDKMGGMVRAIELGFPQREIEESSFRYQQQIERGERIVVGVNAFLEQENKGATSLSIFDPATEQEQCKKLQLLKQNRDASVVSKLLNDLNSAVQSGANLMPAMCDAVSGYVTLGEISDLLRNHYGEFHG